MSDAFKLSSSIELDVTKVKKGLSEASKGFEETKNKADEAEKGTSKFSKVANELGISAKSVGGKVSDLSKKITGGLVAGIGLATAGSQELRADMSKLQVVADTTGNDWSKVNDQFKNFVAVTGETDSSIEALNNLMNAGLQDDNLATAVDYLSGAVEMFPDTLNIEGLADSLQEMSATGQATGMMAELLGRLGINTDEWNKGLAEAQKNGNGLNYIMDTLAKTGLSEVNSKWQENNKNLIESRKANLEFQQAMKNLGDQLMPVITNVVEGLTKVVNWFNQLSPAGQKVTLVIIGLIAIMPAIIGLIGTLATVATALDVALLPVIGVFLAIVAAISAVIAIGYLLMSHWGEVCAYCKDTWNNFVDSIKAKWVAFKEGWRQIVGYLKQDWNDFVDRLRAKWETIIAPFRAVANKIKEIWNGIKSAFKLPHFSLKGEFSLKKMTVPHVAVDWYYNGAIFNKPTLLNGGIGVGDNYNGTGNQAEAVLPISDLRDMIKDLLQVDISLNTNGKVLMREVIAPHIDELDRQLRLRR